ncbi:hypothetical protein Tco_0264444 [Tanacetum coccineum]
MQFLNKEIQSPVAWPTTQSHFGFSSDLSEFGQHLVNKSHSALSKGAHVWRALKNRVITKPAYASATRSKIMAQEPIHAQNINLDKNVRSHHIFNSIIQGAAIRKTTQEEAAKEKTTTEVDDAEENLEEAADVEQTFNNLSTMSFLNISTRSKTTQTAKVEVPKQRRNGVYECADHGQQEQATCRYNFKDTVTDGTANKHFTWSRKCTLYILHAICALKWQQSTLKQIHDRYLPKYKALYARNTSSKSTSVLPHEMDEET